MFLLELPDQIFGLRKQEIRVHDELIQLPPDLCFCLFGAHGFGAVRRSEFLMRLWAEVGANRSLALHPFSFAAVAVCCCACPPGQVADTFQVSG